MILSDREIANLLRSDYDSGIAALFDRYYKPLVLFAHEYVEDINTAEDIVQELFIRLWDNKRLAAIPHNGLSAYMFTSVRNRCRTVQTRAVRPTGITDRLEIDPDYSFSAAIDEELIRRTMKELAALSERTRLAVEYVMVRDMKYQEAADALNISINTLKSSLKDGLRRLRAALDGVKPVLLIAVLFFWLTAR